MGRASKKSIRKVQLAIIFKIESYKAITLYPYEPHITNKALLRVCEVPHSNQLGLQDDFSS